MLIPILAIFLASLLAAFFYKKHQHAMALVLSAFLLGTIAYFGSFIQTIVSGKTITAHIPWIDSLDVHLSFYLDGLSLFFALLITIFGLLIFLYSVKYMKHSAQANRFICYLFLFMG
jgi:multicomponent Na+:H+ antiporter subunit A